MRTMIILLMLGLGIVQAAAQPGRRETSRLMRTLAASMFQPGRIVRVEAMVRSSVNGSDDSALLRWTMHAVDSAHYTLEQDGETQVRLADTLIAINHPLKQIYVSTGSAAGRAQGDWTGWQAFLDQGENWIIRELPETAGGRLLTVESRERLPQTETPLRQAVIVYDPAGNTLSRLQQNTRQLVEVDKAIFEQLEGRHRLLTEKGGNPVFNLVNRYEADFRFSYTPDGKSNAVPGSALQFFYYDRSGTPLPAAGFPDYTIVVF